MPQQKISLKNKRYCWVARETSSGWRLEFHYGNQKSALSGMKFRTLQDVSNALFLAPDDDFAIVVVWMEKNPKRTKEDKIVFERTV